MSAESHAGIAHRTLLRRELLKVARGLLHKRKVLRQLIVLPHQFVALFEQLLLCCVSERVLQVVLARFDPGLCRLELFGELLERLLGGRKLPEGRPVPQSTGVARRPGSPRTAAVSPARPPLAATRGSRAAVGALQAATALLDERADACISLSVGGDGLARPGRGGKDLLDATAQLIEFRPQRLLCVVDLLRELPLDFRLLLELPVQAVEQVRHVVDLQVRVEHLVESR